VSDVVVFSFCTVEHSRVRLGTASNVSNSDYINANTIVRCTTVAMICQLYTDVAQSVDAGNLFAGAKRARQSVHLVSCLSWA